MNAGLGPEDLRGLEQQTPLGRLGTPEDIAAAVSFLASPGAGFITGQVLGVNGGIVI
jgi:3-oxoacyl-[acyl-carrier protein] reductase